MVLGIGVYLCKEQSLYYVSKRTGWVGLENGPFADVQYCIYADKVGGWGPKIY